MQRPYPDHTLYAAWSYLAWWTAMALPLGSVCLDHLGVHLMTVDAHEGGKCSSNMQRYQ
jgi:hypothetical protein